MRVIHYAPFAPNRCGMYEAALDMMQADAKFGHQVDFVDVGMTIKNERMPPTKGARDERGEFPIQAIPPEAAQDADVIVAHTGIPSEWIVSSQVPMVWILHGRPFACFRTERETNGISYSLMPALGAWARIKKMVTFWPEHAPFWLACLPEKKLEVLKAPCVDGDRFNAEGPIYPIPAEASGEVNILIAETARVDSDPYEVAHGVLDAAKRRPGIRCHFYALEEPRGPWEHVLNAFRKENALGEVFGRMSSMERVYRAMDIVVTPHRIATRVMAEALCCGTPVVAALGCKWTLYTGMPDDPESVGTAILNLLEDREKDANLVATDVGDAREAFSGPGFAEEMNRIYHESIGDVPVSVHKEIEDGND